MAKSEQYTALYDYLKHLSTLSTGSILVITAFLEKLFTQPEWKISVGISLVGFLLTVVGVIIFHSITVIEQTLYSEDESNIPDWLGMTGLISILISWFSFIVAIVSMTVFALKNLY